MRDFDLAQSVLIRGVASFQGSRSEVQSTEFAPEFVWVVHHAHYEVVVILVPQLLAGIQHWYPQQPSIATVAMDTDYALAVVSQKASSF